MKLIADCNEKLLKEVEKLKKLRTMRHILRFHDWFRDEIFTYIITDYHKVSRLVDFQSNESFLRKYFFKDE